MTLTQSAEGGDIDLFADEILRDPYPYYRQPRDLGPATYLTRHGLWFLFRYDQARAALGDWKTFSSAHGIGLNPIINLGERPDLPRPAGAHRAEELP